jgi:mRNA interferase MazF
MVLMMKRGDIFYADLNPTVGSEINKKRPVLIVSNDANNRAASTITVLPLTSQVQKVFHFEVLLETQETGLDKVCKAQCQQIRTISKLRITAEKVGEIDQECFIKIDRAIKLHLDLE